MHTDRGNQTEVPMPHSSNEDDSYASASASICSSARSRSRVSAGYSSPHGWEAAVRAATPA